MKMIMKMINKYYIMLMPNNMPETMGKQQR